MTVVTNAYYSGYKVFNYGEETPFVGVLENRLIRGQNNEVQLAYFPGKPVVTISDDLIDNSVKNRWSNVRKGRKILYFPQSLLLLNIKGKTPFKNANYKPLKTGKEYIAVSHEKVP